ncbi:MAG: carboxypeptidase regulatory-like domain-containing protein, partial [bacterium]|nr:carboxypeptidase regulatory-like domain-containing protein [bacterium]
GAQELDDETDYYWRVWPVDTYGAKPATAEVRWLHTDNANPAVRGAVTGKVRDADTGATLVNATIDVQPSDEAGTSNHEGLYFVGDLQQGIYRVEASLAGYTTALQYDVVIESGRYTMIDLVLEPDGGNRSPVLSLVGDRTVAVGETLGIELSAEDLDAGNLLLFLLAGLPEGASFDAGSGVFAWTPAAGQEGVYEFVFSVRDNGSPMLTDDETITVTVGSGATGGPRIEGPGWVAVG